MSILRKVFSLSVLLTLLVAVLPTTASANEPMESQVAVSLQQQLGQAAGESVRVGLPQVELSDSLLNSGMSAEDIAAHLLEGVEPVATGKMASQQRDEDLQVRSVSTPNAVQRQTLSMYMPFAFGFLWINQDFTSDVRNSRLVSLRFNGNSYGTGISVGQWNHVHSRYTVNQSKRTAKIIVKGTMSLLVKGSSVAVPLEASRSYDILTSTLRPTPLFS
ncbi:MAG: hypothetical protein Q4G35_02435 [Propionibacteriaceae bacterium]|nr:hypothetical protein [Propionibacteriaceae bacterium]